MRHGIGFVSSRFSRKYLALSRGPYITTRHSDDGATPSWIKHVEQDTDPEDSICATSWVKTLMKQENDNLNKKLEAQQIQIEQLQKTLDEIKARLQ